MGNIQTPALLGCREGCEHGKPNISLCFPVYDDENTVERVTLKALSVLSKVAAEYEVSIVGDGTPCRAGHIPDDRAAKYPEGRVIHHSRNLGYGTAIRIQTFPASSVAAPAPPTTTSSLPLKTC